MKYDARACQFNMDTGCVELLLRDVRKISIDCTGVEDALKVTMVQKSELDYLIDNDPLAYAELILNGEQEEHLQNVADSHGPEDGTQKQGAPTRTHPEKSTHDKVGREFPSGNFLFFFGCNMSLFRLPSTYGHGLQLQILHQQFHKDVKQHWRNRTRFRITGRVWQHHAAVDFFGTGGMWVGGDEQDLSGGMLDALHDL